MKNITLGNISLEPNHLKTTLRILLYLSIVTTLVGCKKQSQHILITPIAWHPINIQESGVLLKTITSDFEIFLGVKSISNKQGFVHKFKLDACIWDPYRWRRIDIMSPKHIPIESGKSVIVKIIVPLSFTAASYDLSISHLHQASLGGSQDINHVLALYVSGNAEFVGDNISEKISFTSGFGSDGIKPSTNLKEDYSLR